MPNQLNKMYGGEFFTLTVPITGACNFQCSFCAYQYNMKLIKWYPFELFNQILEQIKDLQQSVNRQVIINFSGGEPTIDLKQLQRYVNLAKPYLSDKIRLAIISNGSFGDTQQKITALNQMGFDFIKVTLSQYHYPFQNEQQLIEIAKIIKNLWWMGVDNSPSGVNVKKLYHNLFTAHPNIPLTVLSERKTTQNMYKAMLAPDAWSCTRKLKPDGIYCFANGDIGPECPGMGNEFSCKLGQVKDLLAIGEKVINAGMDVILQAKTFGENIQQIFHPACLQMRKLGIPCTCFDTKTVKIWAEGLPPKTHWKIPTELP